MIDVPDYIEARIRRRQPEGVPVVPLSTPVVAFGDARNSRVATLGLNPSRLEFLGRDGNELLNNKRRLETLTSIRERDLTNASDNAIRLIFQGCNNYFHRRPYGWFKKLEKILKHVDASYYDGSACHLDFVQWATDPVWTKLSRSDQGNLTETDLPFLDRQLSQEKVRLLLLNGTGIMKAYERGLGGKLSELPLPGIGRVKVFTGHDPRGLKAVGWNINLQSSFGVSNEEIEAIAGAVKMAASGTWW